MTDAIDDAEFLSRSAHREQVLSMLSEEPHERSTLQDRTGISRVTISRTLAAMEEKGWVDHDGWRYWLTPLGEIVAEEFTGLLSSLTTVQKLNEILDWLPLEEIGTELRNFSDAEITLATQSNASAPVQAFSDTSSGAERIRILAYGVSPFLITRHQMLLEDTDQPFDIVLSADHYEALRSNEYVANVLNTIALSGVGSYYRYDGEITHHLLLTEDAVGLLLTDVNGMFPAYIESRNDEIYDWAETLFEEHLQDSTPVRPEEFDTKR